MKRVIARLIRWATVESAGADQGSFQTQGITYLGRSGLSASWYPYGYSALAPSDTLALLMTISGQTDARVHIPGSPRERPTLKPGEVVMYHPLTGAKVHFKIDGTVEVVSPTAVTVTAPSATVTAPTIALTGNVTVTGNLTVTGTTGMTGAITLGGTLTTVGGVELTAHVHTETGGSGPTEAPRNP